MNSELTSQVPDGLAVTGRGPASETSAAVARQSPEQLLRAARQAALRSHAATGGLSLQRGPGTDASG